jgi:hypothetical protein
MSVLKIRNDADDAWIEIGGTTVAANWELVASLSQTDSGILDWDVTGLQGDTYHKYKVEVRYFEDTSSGANQMKLQLNLDTAANYQYEAHWFGGGHDHISDSSEANIPINLCNSNANSWGEGIVHALSGFPRYAIFDAYRSQASGYQVVGTWNNTTDEVTSITLFSDDTCKCEIRIYRWVDVEDSSVANSTTHNCVVYATREAAQTINNTTETKIIHDNIHIDRGGHYDTDDNRVIATQKGVYKVDASVTYNSMNGGAGFDCQIHVNGTKVSWHRNQIDFTGTGSQTTFWTGELDVGEYVEHFVFHGAGSSRTTKDPFIGGTSMAVELLYTTT